ncbi:MAG: pentapeptide repeat-containing protein [Pleurocapsa sp.]
MIHHLEQHYKVLGLKVGASLEEINQAYKNLALMWHPDRIPQDDQNLVKTSAEKFKEINHARDLLRAFHRQHRPQSSSRQSNRYYSNEQQSYSKGEGSSKDREGSQYRRSYSRPGYNDYTSGSNRSDRSETESRQYSDYSYTEPKKTNNHTSDRPNSETRRGYYSSYYTYNSTSSYTEQKRAYYRPEPSYTRSTEPQECYETKSSQQQRGSYYQNQTTNSYRRPDHKDMVGMDFSNANFKEKDLSGRNLKQANFSHADLSDSFLHKVNFEEANLRGANLFRANLLQANLKKADLRDVNLIGADLSGADLSGANLKGAKVGYGNKIMVKLTGVKLTGATLPDGTIHD